MGTPFNPFSLSGRHDTESLRDEFARAAREELRGSGLDIDALLASGAVRLLWSHREIGTALNWTMRGASKQQLRRASYALAYCNQDGSVWQAKLAFPMRDALDKKKPAKYMAPTGAGSVLYRPKLTEAQYLAIEAHHGVIVPRDIDFWVWLEEHPEIPVEVTEGGKKALALLDCGLVGLSVFGVSSGWVRKRDKDGKRLNEKAFVPGLEPLVAEREFRFWFDQDEKAATRTKVRAALTQLGIQLQRAGAVVSVCCWNIKSGKGVDDVYSAGGKASIAAIERWRVAFGVWNAQALSQLTHEPAVELDQRYLPDAREYGDRKWLAVKSPKGTGKTFSLRGLVEEYKAKGNPVIILTHRVQLGAALCESFGLPFGTRNGATVGGLDQYGLCIDSLHDRSGIGFNWESLEGLPFLLVIDEVEQVMNHALTARTAVEGHRARVQETLARLLFMIAVTDGARLVTMDADHCDLSIEHLQSISGLDGFQMSPYLIVNNYNPADAQKIFDYSGFKADAWLSHLKSAVVSGKKLLIVTSGQKENSTYGTQSLEAAINEWLAEECGKGRGHVLRVDSESIATKDHDAFGCISNFVERAKRYQVVVASPTIETGISIENDDFELVFGIFQGVQTENSVRQALARVRRPIDRHIWVSDRAMLASDQYSMPNQIKNNWHSHRGYIDQILAKPKYAIAFSRGDQDDRVAVVSAIESQARYMALANAGKWAYRASVLHGLKMEGHEVIDATLAQQAAAAACGADLVGFSGEEAKEQLKDAKKNVCETNHKAVALSLEIDKPKSESISTKKAANKAERDSNRKFKLCEYFGYEDSEMTAALVGKLSDSEWASRLKLLFFCTIGAEFVELHDYKKAAFSSANGASQAWMPDLAARALSPKIQLLHTLGVPALLLDGDREFCEHDPDVIRLLELGLGRKGDVRRLLGISLNEKTKPMGFLASLLRRVGLSLERGRREGGTRYRSVDRIEFGDAERHVANHWWMAWAEARSEHESDILHRYAIRYLTTPESKREQVLDESAEAFTAHPKPTKEDRISRFIPKACALVS